jgi:hypothetical protein
MATDSRCSLSDPAVCGQRAIRAAVVRRHDTAYDFVNPLVFWRKLVVGVKIAGVLYTAK